MVWTNARLIRFQSTPSVGRATNKPTVDQQWWLISIHALRGEGDLSRMRLPETMKTFQSTPSVGRATSCAHDLTNNKAFQSTPSVGRATLTVRQLAAAVLFQSTPSVGRATSSVVD